MATVLPLLGLAASCSMQGPEPASRAVRHLDFFVRTLSDYCLGADSREKTIISLLASGRFHLSPAFEGVYEASFEHTSYAVTPEVEDCTVDVLLEFEPGKTLFALNAVDDAIRALGYKRHEELSTVEEGANGNSVNVAEYRYYPLNARRNEIILSYPLDNQAAYYMTVSYDYE